MAKNLDNQLTTFTVVESNLLINGSNGPISQPLQKSKELLTRIFNNSFDTPVIFNGTKILPNKEINLSQTFDERILEERLKGNRMEIDISKINTKYISVQGIKAIVEKNLEDKKEVENKNQQYLITNRYYSNTLEEDNVGLEYIEKSKEDNFDFKIQNFKNEKNCIFLEYRIIFNGLDFILIRFENGRGRTIKQGSYSNVYTALIAFQKNLENVEFLKFNLITYNNPQDLKPFMFPEKPIIPKKFVEKVDNAFVETLDKKVYLILKDEVPISKPWAKEEVKIKATKNQNRTFKSEQTEISHAKQIRREVPSTPKISKQISTNKPIASNQSLESPHLRQNVQYKSLSHNFKVSNEIGNRNNYVQQKHFSNQPKRVVQQVNTYNIINNSLYVKKEKETFTPEVQNYEYPNFDQRQGYNYGRPDLQYTRPDLQYTRPDLQYSRPDLQYSRPDLQYTRPDLQYTRPDLNYGQQIYERKSFYDQINSPYNNTYLPNRNFRPPPEHLNQTPRTYVERRSYNDPNRIIDQYRQVEPNYSYRERPTYINFYPKNNIAPPTGGYNYSHTNPKVPLQQFGCVGSPNTPYNNNYQLNTYSTPLINQSYPNYPKPQTPRLVTRTPNLESKKAFPTNSVYQESYEKIPKQRSVEEPKRQKRREVPKNKLEEFIALDEIKKEKERSNKDMNESDDMGFDDLPEIF